MTNKGKSLSGASQIQQKPVGESTRNLVSLPETVCQHWNLTYGNYVRVSVIPLNGDLKIAISPMPELSYGKRSNDMKLNTTTEIPLPRRLVRLLGIEDDIWWEKFDEQIIGSLMGYNDSRTLLKVINHYDSDLFTSNKHHDSTPHKKITFSALTEKVKNESIYHYSTGNPSHTYRSRNSIHHTLPNEDFGFVENMQYSFMLFYDGEGFVIGLLPAPANISVRTQNIDENPSSLTLNSVFLPNGGNIRVTDSKGNRIGHSEELDGRVYTNYTVEFYEPVTESKQVTVAAYQNGNPYKFENSPVERIINLIIEDESPTEKVNKSRKRRNESTSSSTKYNPLSASPYDTPEFSESDIPEIALEYQKDSVTVHRNENNQLYYTVPKQVAETLWLENDFMTDWISIDSKAFFGRLTPEKRSTTINKLDVSKRPN